MDYEQKYNEALNDMRVIYPNLKGDAKLAVEHAFPELAESEDERIRKKLYNTVMGTPNDSTWFDGTSKEAMLAWLEKQKEQKPASTEDMPYITDEHFYEREPADSFKYKLAEYMTQCCTKKEGPYGYEYGISAETILKMAEEELLKRGVVQKPAEWSEEDEKMIERLITRLNWITYNTRTDGTSPNITFFDEIAWLKSLRPSWKPSEDEERLINTSISFLKDFADKGYENAVECIDWLKSKLSGNSGK